MVTARYALCAWRSAANGVSQNGQWTMGKGRLDACKSAIQRSVGS